MIAFYPSSGALEIQGDGDASLLRRVLEALGEQVKTVRPAAPVYGPSQPLLGTPLVGDPISDPYPKVTWSDRIYTRDGGWYVSNSEGFVTGLAGKDGASS